MRIKKELNARCKTCFHYQKGVTKWTQDWLMCVHGLHDFEGACKKYENMLLASEKILRGLK